MAVFTRVIFVLKLFFIYLLIFAIGSQEDRDLDRISLHDIEQITRRSCVLAGLPFAESLNDHFLNVLRKLQFSAFKSEPNVRIALLKQEKDLLKAIKWDGGDLPSLYNDSIVFFPKIKPDRVCLTPKPKLVLTAEVWKDNVDAQLLLLYLNSKCETFQMLDGSLSVQGKRRQDILTNLYHLPRVPYPAVAAECERIAMPSREEFIHKYLFRSKPVIIEGALQKWTALKKWTNIFLESKFGKNMVHIKMTSDGIFEGCDKAKHFSNFKTFHAPDFVSKQLPFPELVVVRPATMNLNFSSFMDMIRRPPKTNMSAYLEYSSIPDHMPELEQDIAEFDFVKNILTRRHLNIWLSNGNTLGKLHFDPYENFLCQISGSKQVTLFEPHKNEELYEGHIQEAILAYDERSKKFSKKKLLDSTSMVMSPIDILRPDYKHFPKFREVPGMKCTIREGDVLYMPSFWWHEVQSKPSEEKRNLAVNFWYEPFLTKEFPCAECPMNINPHYFYNLL
ncbi:bifunctional peptidase and (3S)-lysyl hydroxylase JMJD7-like [Dendronephthya gigantea]|uniref:bifunctional peptidase and (3S)-lysyl hydroxylase JMJD7-like n=1 Tax=Dendronephthya gigantea TaxID=151771 RepID=UPI001069C667|nr:bifunctional peptidase and (3S)-lysyl hydroxylase JMJD7-like [Dendronephthya gigantea]